MTPIPTAATLCNGFANCGEAPLLPPILLILIFGVIIILVNRVVPEVDE